MVSGILGRKIGMTRIIDEHGVAEPVTVIKAGPCVVMQVKSAETDGYEAVQLGFEDVKPHRSTVPQIGHASRAGTGPKRFIREIRLGEPADVNLGDVVTVDAFTENEVKYVDVMGTTRGFGFAGVMKRHNFGGKEASHGVERKHRSAGSIGGHANTGTGRGIKKGKRMAGHYGVDRRTSSSLRLLKVDAENDLLLIRGSVPGCNGTYVVIKKAKKRG